jgi:predicted amidophosphoribosyltransferase
MPPMALRIHCSFCSAEVRNDSNICPSCGRALDEVASRRLDEEPPQISADHTDQDSTNINLQVRKGACPR